MAASADIQGLPYRGIDRNIYLLEELHFGFRQLGADYTSCYSDRSFGVLFGVGNSVYIAQ